MSKHTSKIANILDEVYNMIKLKNFCSVVHGHKTAVLQSDIQEIIEKVKKKYQCINKT